MMTLPLDDDDATPVGPGPYEQLLKAAIALRDLLLVRAQQLHAQHDDRRRDACYTLAKRVQGLVDAARAYDWAKPAPDEYVSDLSALKVLEADAAELGVVP